MKLKEAVEKTVDFWTEKSFLTAINQNNGDDSPNGGMGFAIMNMVSMNAQQSITEEKIEKFKTKLTEILMENPNEYMDVDYHPCGALSKSAEFAGLDSGCFPCKSWSTIQQEGAEYTPKASYQYQGELKEI